MAGLTAQQRCGNDALFGVAAGSWRTGGSVAENVVANIDDLVKRGVLVKEPGGGRSMSYALSDRWIR